MSRHGNKAKSHVLKDCHMPDLLEPEEEKDTLWTAAKVIATIGPAVHDVESLVKLLEAGVTCCRVDLTWGSVEYHRKSLANLLEASKRAKKLCAVIVDIVGREITVQRPIELDADGWPVHGEEVMVKAGDQVVLSTKDLKEAAPGTFPVNFPGFSSMVEVGDTVFLGRYLVTGADESSLYLEVTDISGTEVTCKANNDASLGGLLTVFHIERSSDTVENVQNDLQVLSQYDKDAIKSLADSFEIDFLSLSFCRSGEDILEARDFLDSLGMGTTKILAKLESRQSLFNFKAIAAASDGVVMSRGTLGLDVVPEKMALIQKAIISNCNIMGKPVIVTRLVDTMSNSPRPTRAEATDVANAVMDGCDAFLLGAETLRGRFPVLTVTTIMSIARQAEAVFDHMAHFDHLMQETVAQQQEANGGRLEHSLSNVSMQAMNFGSDTLPADSPHTSQHGPGPAGRAIGRTGSNAASMATVGSTVNLRRSAKGGQPSLTKMESIASSAVRAADKVQASLIVVYTSSGRTASMVARYRPPMPILTLVVPQLKSDGLSWTLTGRATARQCLIERGLLPVLAAPSPDGEGLLEEAIHMTNRWGLVAPGDHVVVIQMLHDNMSLKIVSVDQFGRGIADIRPQSLVDMIKAEEEKAGVTADGGGDGGRGAALGLSRTSVYGSKNRRASVDLPADVSGGNGPGRAGSTNSSSSSGGGKEKKGVLQGLRAMLPGSHDKGGNGTDAATGRAPSEAGPPPPSQLTAGAQQLASTGSAEPAGVLHPQ